MVEQILLHCTRIAMEVYEPVNDTHRWWSKRYEGVDAEVLGCHRLYESEGMERCP